MDFVLPDPLQASDDAISASPPSLSTSPAMTSDYTSLIDSVMRDEDIEALLGDDSLTWDFILAQPSSPSASSAAASGPPLTPPRSVSQSRRESLASSVPSELRSEEPYEVADASIMTSVGVRGRSALPARSYLACSPSRRSACSPLQRRARISGRGFSSISTRRCQRSKSRHSLSLRHWRRQRTSSRPAGSVCQLHRLYRQQSRASTSPSSAVFPGASSSSRSSFSLSSDPSMSAAPSSPRPASTLPMSSCRSG
jgi:hypothetical protein